MQRESSEQTLTGYDWETVLRRVRLGDVPPHWQVQVYSPQAGLMSFFGSSMISLLGTALFLIAAIAAGSAIMGWAVVGIGVLGWLYRDCREYLFLNKNEFIVLLPEGLIRGNLRQAQPHILIDYANVIDIQIRRTPDMTLYITWDVRVEQLPKNAKKPGQVFRGPSLFAEPKALARSIEIEQAFLRFTLAR